MVACGAQLSMIAVIPCLRAEADKRVDEGDGRVEVQVRAAPLKARVPRRPHHELRTAGRGSIKVL